MTRRTKRNRSKLNSCAGRMRLRARARPMDLYACAGGAAGAHRSLTS
jgi:hypothetical protein